MTAHIYLRHRQDAWFTMLTMEPRVIITVMDTMVRNLRRSIRNTARLRRSSIRNYTSSRNITVIITTITKRLFVFNSNILL